MRRLILLLLVALLPLNAWMAVASMRCLHEAEGGHHLVQGGDAGRGQHTSHAHHAAHGDRVDHFGHGDPGEHVTRAGGDADCAHADCGGCCHAAGTAAFGFARLPVIGRVFADAPVAVVDASPDCPSLDGLFRPPRTASA